MKIQLTFKTPDVVNNYLEQKIIIKDFDAEDPPDTDVFTDAEILEEKIREACSKFVEYGEYCTIEIDTETKEARVIPVRC